MTRPEKKTAPDEFGLIDLIRQQAQLNTWLDDGVIQGIGDDCAILKPPAGQLLVSSDTLNSGVHFFADDPPEAIGHKALAVNLSDLAACGATPRWASLNLSLPGPDTTWLRGFLHGFLGLAACHRVRLIGGDTTCGPLSISVTVMGHSTHPLRRAGARPGDLLAVSGELGSAAFALKHRRQRHGWALSRARLWPQPRLDISRAIASFAHAGIDISDGLLADAGHLCQASGLSAIIKLENLPVNPLLRQHDPDWPALALSGGDDYQLLFALAPADRHKLPPDCTVIGLFHQAKSQPLVQVQHHGQPFSFDNTGYRHFS